MSATTRPPRPGEVDGVHYCFVDDEEFDRMVADGELLEWAVVHGQPATARRGGRSRRRWPPGAPALLEIDLQGARQVRESMPEALFVFLAPPSLGRAGPPAGRPGHRDAEDERERRLETARDELAAEAEFDVTIVNADVHEAARGVGSLDGTRSEVVRPTRIVDDLDPNLRPQ